MKDFLRRKIFTVNPKIINKTFKTSGIILLNKSIKEIEIISGIKIRQARK
jgi:hypothetical protein